ncbi:hypothetical protein AT15_06485 [Kosmotoga arenicorallina S304]|uniref:High-affinity iron transporter n=1 Tax=Kosmotoga arenicorallina S304 TaxID=1453497 RepID=A0A176JTE3_9BACT|nr:FTR1 family protein [Kosmotoga arenicorallina]OAA26531.1 hypothetical protein AT15_06485 [Kosmotoga arenicorallina S304]
MFLLSRSRRSFFPRGNGSIFYGPGGSILFDHIHRKNNLEKSIWTGTALAIISSILLAFVFNMVFGNFEGRVEEIFEGVLMLLAAGVLTYMIFWMQFKRAEFEGKVDRAVSEDKPIYLGLLAFSAVVREGVETVLFFSAIKETTEPFLAAIGGISGILIAVVLSFLLYKGTSKLSISKLFFWSGMFLFIIAAGLFAHGIHEFQEAGLLPVFIEHIYDLNGILSENGVLGGILKAVFGYNGNPSFLEFLSYWLFIGTIGSTAINKSRKLQQLSSV